MSVSVDVMADDDTDASVDVEIATCLNLDAPKSFFLFAGAGSGKTRSLVTALEHVQATMSDRLRAKGQKVAVITFTNAASDEIKSRLRFDPLIDVRTIHSFAWSLVEGFNHDIREWLKVDLAANIQTLAADEAKGRKGTKASATRLSKIESKTRRLANLPVIKSFTYSPTGTNRGRDSLNHAEVLQLAAHFLSTKPAMQSILVGRHPILLIDESQDTNKHLVDAFFQVEAKLKGKFLLGLLGDMMQRIYTDGKEGLGQDLPDHWATPTKKLNYRCPRRVINLINKVRSATDNQVQLPPTSAKEGLLRFFILPSDLVDKPEVERAIARYMAKATGDEHWKEPKLVKTLTLEHRMAASRLGFLDAFSPLYDYENWRTSLLDGSLVVLKFFSDQVLSLVKAKRAGDRFATARIVKANSPLLSQAALRASVDAQAQLSEVGAAVVKASGADEELDPPAERDLAIQEFLNAPFSQIEPMAEYLLGNAPFDTHQGVKGLQFDRVMVIMDDVEARGFSFKYEDLFGGKAAGDKSVENTRRLFYVTASRAKESLALVAYSSAPSRVRNFLLGQGWFTEDELIDSVSA